MRNRFLAVSRRSIPYIKELRPYAGSVAGCIIMQQLDYWFERHPDGFYKFLEPCENNAKYRQGSSWTEELGVSAKEFRTAFDNIGIRYGSKREYDEAPHKFMPNELEGIASEHPREQFYCSYHDKIRSLTFYFRNHSLVDSLLDNLLLELPDGKLRNFPSGSYVTSGGASTELPDGKSDIDSESTAESTAQPGSPNGSPSRAPARSSARGTRIPADFKATEEMKAWAAENTPGVDVKWYTDEFVDYWKSRAGRDACKLDWEATWKNRMRAVYVARQPKQGGVNGEPPKPSQFESPRDKRIRESRERLAEAQRRNAESGAFVQR